MSDNNQEAVKPVMGWMCPRCKRVYAPTCMECGCSPLYFNTTEGTFTPIESKEPVSPAETGVRNPVNVKFMTDLQAKESGERVIERHGDLLEKLAKEPVSPVAEEKLTASASFNEATKCQFCGLSGMHYCTGPATATSIGYNNMSTNQVDIEKMLRNQIYKDNDYIGRLHAKIKADAVEIERLNTQISNQYELLQQAESDRLSIKGLCNEVNSLVLKNTILENKLREAREILK